MQRINLQLHRNGNYEIHFRSLWKVKVLAKPLCTAKEVILKYQFGLTLNKHQKTIRFFGWGVVPELGLFLLADRCKYCFQLWFLPANDCLPFSSSGSNQSNTRCRMQVQPSYCTMSNDTLNQSKRERQKCYDLRQWLLRGRKG